MKTRTLLLLSVGTALMILLAGGVLLLQLSGQESTTEPTPVGERVEVGDVEVTVLGSAVEGGRLSVDLDLGGVDDPDGIESFRLVTGDRRLDPVPGSGDGRCAGIVEQSRRCAVEFDVSATDGTSRVLVLRRGEEQATWRLG